MASGEHSCTRRDLLGAAVAVPVLRYGSSTGSAPTQDERSGDDRTGPDLAAWLLALAAVRRAERRMKEFARRTGGRARPFAAQCRVDERFSDFVCAYNRALEALILAPAPDLHAFARKIALLVDEQAWELPAADACLARVKEDAAELAAVCG